MRAYSFNPRPRKRGTPNRDQRVVEINGDAVGGVSDDLKARHPEIPWRGVIAQRHVLAHDYGAIKQKRIWLVATQRVPELIERLKPLLPQTKLD